jgi:hypothetical protein
MTLDERIEWTNKVLDDQTPSPVSDALTKQLLYTVLRNQLAIMEALLPENLRRELRVGLGK